MKTSITRAAMTCLATMFISSMAFSQARTNVNTEQIFRLSDTASFQQGCFDPCLCPIQSPLNMRGTMMLGPTSIGDAFNFRPVTEINIYVSDDNGADIHVLTGSGGYYISNFGAPPVHGLELDIQIDGGEVQHFFSELEPVESNDGSFNIQVSINGLYCYDTVLQMNASPVPVREIKSYTLNRQAMYQQGCWDPCDCPLWSPVPLVGDFKLVPLRNLGTYVEYAVVDLAFKADGFSNSNPNGENLEITGAGLYTLIAGFAGMIESMDLQLSLDNELPVAFSSGFINSGEEFPAIDIDVSMNGLVCFDRLLSIRADLRSRRQFNGISNGGGGPGGPPQK